MRPMSRKNSARLPLAEDAVQKAQEERYRDLVVISRIRQDTLNTARKPPSDCKNKMQKLAKFACFFSSISRHFTVELLARQRGK